MTLLASICIRYHIHKRFRKIIPKRTEGIESLGGCQKRNGAIKSHWNVQFVPKDIEIVQLILITYNPTIMDATKSVALRRMSIQL